MRSRANVTDRRGAQASRWLRLAAWAAGIAVLGFGLGVVVGIIGEEPELLLAHVSGDSRAVGLTEAGAPPDASDPGDPAPVPDVAAEPPPEVPVAPAPAPARAAAEPPRAATVPRGQGFSVQVGAFGEEAAAERLAASLRARGLPVYVAAAPAGGPAGWRVRVGPVAQRAEAERLAARLAADRLPTWVRSEAER